MSPKQEPSFGMRLRRLREVAGITQEAQERGRAMTFEQAVAYALEDDEASPE